MAKAPAVAAARPRSRRPRTGDIEKRLAVLGCDPIAILAEIATDAESDTRLRFQAAKELAAFIAPRRPGAAASRTDHGTTASAVDIGRVIERYWEPPVAAPGPEEKA